MTKRRGRPPGIPKTGGRQKGTPNRRTAEIMAKATEGGISPLDVMLNNMREFWQQAEEAPDATEQERLRLLASEEAQRAAPYVHPKLSAATLDHKGISPVSDLLRQVAEQQRQAIPREGRV
jgi:hypothetical protein